MEEQIDVLNSDGSAAGFFCGRTEVHAKGLYHKTVHIWAFDEKGNILFQLRSKQKENNPGLLDTSCAGHISAGDSSVNAGVRELFEELGIQKKASDLQYLFTARHESILNNGAYIDNEFYDTYRIELSNMDIEKLKPQSGEVDDFIWLSLESFFEMFKKNPEKFVNHPEDFAYLKTLIM